MAVKTSIDPSVDDLDAAVAAVIESVDAMAGPAWLIDVAAARLVTANAGGREVWGLAGDHELPLVLDPEMPALSHLADATADGEIRTMVLWTAKGARRLTCRLEAVGPGLVRVALAGSAGGGAPAAGRSEGQTELAAGNQASMVLANVPLRALAHELRTPLSAIATFAEMIEAEHFGALGDPRYREYAHHIRQSARTALETIATMLDEAHAAAMPDVGDVREFEPGPLVAGFARGFEPLAREAGVVLEVSCDEGAPRLIASASAVTQILDNLLTNAVKFTPPGGRVSIVVRQAGAGGLEIDVVDTGLGMTRSQTRLLWTGEAAAGGEAGTAHAGRGVGFTLLRQLCARVGARLELQTERGTGTRATLVFSQDRLVARASRADV